MDNKEILRMYRFAGRFTEKEIASATGISIVTLRRIFDGDYKKPFREMTIHKLNSFVNKNRPEIVRVIKEDGCYPNFTGE